MYFMVEMTHPGSRLNAAARLDVQRVGPGERLGHGRVEVLRYLTAEVEAGQGLRQGGVLAHGNPRLASRGHDAVGDQAAPGGHHLRCAGPLVLEGRGLAWLVRHTDRGARDVG